MQFVLLPASESGLRFLKVISEEQIQGSHAVLECQREVWPRAPEEAKQKPNLNQNELYKFKDGYSFDQIILKPVCYQRKSQSFKSN